jgi:uncharacterized protein YabN with tetrapyrrole methylase and pyrophosphatase domain
LTDRGALKKIVMILKDKKNPGNKPIKDLGWLLGKHQFVIEQLGVLVRQKERYLARCSSPIIRAQLEVLYAAIVAIAESMEQFTAVYNELANEYLFSTYEANALRYALPAKRTHQCKARELYALRYQIQYKCMPPRGVPDQIREKVDRFERSFSREEKVM